MKISFSLKSCLLLIASTQMFAGVLEYPIAVNSRPGTMPVGMFAVNANLNFKTPKTPSLDAALSFGVAQSMQGSVAYNGVELDKDAKFKVGRVVTLGYKFSYFSTDCFGTFVQVGLPVHIADGEIIKDLTIANGFVGFNEMISGGIVPKLTWTMRPATAFAFEFPVFFGVQTTEQLWIEANSNLGIVKMTNEKNQAEWKNTPFWTEVPVELKSIFAISNYVDVSANVGLSNAMKFKETFNFGVGVEIRG